MQYAIVAIGSRGDVQPYIALALGLMERGHTATLLAHENFKEFVEGYGIRFVAVKGHIEEMLRSPAGMVVVRDGSLSAFTRFLQKVNKITADSLIRDTMDEFEKADVFVASLLAMPWVDAIAEKLGKKWAIVQLNLPTIKTNAFPLVFLGFFNFPAYNKLSYRFFEWIYWRVNKKNINEFRHSLGLPVLRISILKKIADGKILNLHCFSPSLLARPNDWEAHNDITGFLFLSGTTHNNISVDLIHWLNDGERPIYIGFGSIPVPDSQLFTKTMTELLGTTNHRFVFCQGWSHSMNLPKHPNLFQIKSVSHEWLLPHCKAAVIHGGIGTTAAVLRAKIPVIIVSIIADQPWWGKIIERKHLGVHIPFKKVSTEKLLDAIRKIRETAIKKAVMQIGERINSDNGLQRTIGALERYFGESVHY